MSVDRMSVDLRSRMEAEGLRPSTWGNGPHDRYGAHDHAYDKVLVVERGSIVFHLVSTGGSAELREGDRLELPGGTLHAATVGPGGVRCLEAHLPFGTLEAQPRLVAGWGLNDGEAGDGTVDRAG
jgi:uncharacterized protein YjlB